MDLSKKLQNICKQCIIDKTEVLDQGLEQPVTARLVTDVAQNSPAEYAQIKVGDILLEVNGQPATEFNFWRDAETRDNHTYKIYKPNTSLIQTLTMTSIPLGIATTKSKELILREYESGNGRHENLIDLWELQDWETLKTIGDRWKKPNMLGLWLETSFKDRQAHSWKVEYLFKGIAEWEIGDAGLGQRIVEDFADKYAEDLQTAYSAIVLHNRAKRYWKADDRDRAIETLKTAYEYNPLQLIVQEFERFKAEPPQPEHSILGTRVEKDYCFPEATEIDGDLSLYQTLQTLSGEAIHLICILYQSRANQPYDRFMERYRTYARCFPFIFSSLDVIAGDSENVGWLENEQQAIAQNLRLRVIIEPDNSVAEYFDVESIPAVFGVDKRARVVLDNQLYDEVALWKWLNQYAALRSKIDG